MMFRAATLAALVAYAAAQSLSTNCTAALTGIAANPDASKCLSPGSLVSVVAAGANNSIIPPINNWLTSLCGAPACSNDTIAAVVKNVTEGCSTELSGLGFTSSLTPSITSIIQQYYPTVRKVVCLKDGDTNCVTQTLTNIQDTVGTLSLTNLAQIALNPPTSLPANVTCTNCVKAAYNIINTDVPSIVADVAPALQSQCGASFTDGTTPSGISQSASTADASSTSKAAALGSVSMMSRGVVAGLGASGLVVLSTVFTFLA
ncbi:hypothetical protein M413DRAFT_446381 [Hebeloma cylindrosporum]|uniref:Secreted protein n=1 Tax=Hebeloma cylindrosporum TaxID=76867 RepID=A0A0C2XRH5_HEBCY|nr:hypothetical protein M413DRAFT_446381 [Hebeloma cylindrosporum h7]